MNGLRIEKDTKLEPKVYLLPEGITFDSDNVTLDGQGATILGMEKTGAGIKVSGRNNIVIKNLRLMNYYHGISIKQSKGIELENCRITSTAELPSNTLFLDIWKPASEAYGAAIFLDGVTDTKIHDNDLQHQMNGILSYHCKNLDVMNNITNYCSGFGFHLYETCDSTFADNYADYCCRYYLSDSGSHLGADAAGFLIVQGSSRNVLNFSHTLDRACPDGDTRAVEGFRARLRLRDRCCVVYREILHHTRHPRAQTLRHISKLLLSLLDLCGELEQTHRYRS